MASAFSARSCLWPCSAAAAAAIGAASVHNRAAKWNKSLLDNMKSMLAKPKVAKAA